MVAIAEAAVAVDELVCATRDAVAAADILVPFPSFLKRRLNLKGGKSFQSQPKVVLVTSYRRDTHSDGASLPGMCISRGGGFAQQLETKDHC